jgi:RPA family protein
VNQDDLIIQREVRRFLEKRLVDATLAVITHSKGYITVGGTIRSLRSEPFVKVHDEIAQFQTQVMRSMYKEIKSVTIEAKIIDLHKKEREFDPLPPRESTTTRKPTSHT